MNMNTNFEAMETAKTILEPISAPKPEINIDPTLRRNLIIYLLVTAAAFFYLAVPFFPAPTGYFGARPRAGVSLPLFMLIQAGFLYYLIPHKKPLLTLIPIFILSLNAFISANPMWRGTNFIVTALLFGFMARWIVTGVSLKDTSAAIFMSIAETICNSFTRFPIPFRWMSESAKGKTANIRRVVIGIAISIPALLFLIVMLSQADMIFERAVGAFFNRFFQIIQPRVIIRLIAAVFVALYLFGITFGILTVNKEQKERLKSAGKTGDPLIVNIVLASVLLVYTVFIIFQIRYLFAPPDSLPYGLDFVEYARRGFFELLFLTGVNIVFILIAVALTKTQTGRGGKITRAFCLYLCAVTVVLLISSFYRMWLYGSDDGLTRMRTLVFGFLIFEAIGLIATFFYIVKPSFNIISVYALVAFTYFLVLNLVPIDRIIARDQVNRYFQTGRGGVDYVLTLSPDAAPEVARLLHSESSRTRFGAENFFLTLEETRPYWRQDWRQWNLSLERALENAR
jgi:hypothetical protein